jgi:hypothetical protein
VLRPCYLQAQGEQAQHWHGLQVQLVHVQQAQVGAPLAAGRLPDVHTAHPQALAKATTVTSAMIMMSAFMTVSLRLFSV